MVKLTNGALTTAAVLSLLGSVQAAPSGDIAIKSLVKRANNFEDCDTDQRKKAGQALADATVLARWTFDHQYKDHPYQDTDAFKHYFEPDDYTRHVRTMFDLIQQNNDPTNPPYQFIVTCKDAPVCGGKDGSLAVTDALPRSKTFMPRIRLCPKFFNPNTLETKYDLGSRDFKKNPGRRDNSWCQPGKPFSFFETAGHTILHEMTHLDEIANGAGLSDRPVDRSNINGPKSHGTEDVYELKDPDYKNYPVSSPEKSARNLKENWGSKKKDHDPILQRVDNAESYAASATEFYFQHNCDWDTIQE